MIYSTVIGVLTLIPNDRTRRVRCIELQRNLKLLILAVGGNLELPLPAKQNVVVLDS